MKRGTVFSGLLGIVILWWILYPLNVRAEIASDNAFEGVTWEKIIEDNIEGPLGLVQSICATEDYIICIENYADGTVEPDIIKAYYRNDKDAEGNPVQKYSLAKRVADLDYEHANGMAYNPDTGEIAVALYTNLKPENRGCIYIMDADTLEYKRTVKISDDYNILGIGYDEAQDRYVIQTNADGGYSFKILDGQFQVTEDLGEYAGTAKGDNFQDLCVSGDYIINFPLTLGMGIGDYVHVYSISRRALVSDPQLNFNFENVIADEPESICELEPGVFLATVTVVYADGRRTNCIYKTMVPYNFTAAEVEKQEEDAAGTGNAEEGIKDKTGTEKEQTVPEQGSASGKGKTDGKKFSAVSVLKGIGKVTIVIVCFLAGFLILYAKIVSVRRERRRKLQHARRERERIRGLYEEESAEEPAGF